MATNGLVVAHLPSNGSGKTWLWADGQLIAIIEGAISEISAISCLHLWAIFIQPLGSTNEVSIFADRFVKGDR